LGIFFGILFLAVTVLIIYFKQISEGYEDKAQFSILQKVGMDDAQVKATINRQVLWVFFIPLGMTILHMVFASKIMARMLQMFMLYDWGLVLCCIGGVCVVFALLYLIVYRLTARVYYRIVKW
jgi:putative ABC transport system permease protein